MSCTSTAFCIAVGNFFDPPSDYYKKNGNGNSPYCAVYVGPFNLGSLGPGAGGATGASSVRLVE